MSYMYIMHIIGRLLGDESRHQVTLFPELVQPMFLVHGRAWPGERFESPAGGDPRKIPVKNRWS